MGVCSIKIFPLLHQYNSILQHRPCVCVCAHNEEGNKKGLSRRATNLIPSELVGLQILVFGSHKIGKTQMEA